MQNLIFINKYDKLKKKITACIPEDSAVIRLDERCVLVSLPRRQKRKEVLASCRERLDEEQGLLLQPLIGYKESNERIEVALPGITRFFPKDKHNATQSSLVSATGS